MALNIAHSEFPEQRGGLMICGYEWGGGDEEAEGGDAPRIEEAAICTFANKDLRYGPAALSWPYDRRIKKWFAIWGHPLNPDDPGDFERSIIQTNWCDSQNPRMNGDYTALWAPAQSNNFLNHVKHFAPRLILLMGSRLIDALQHPSTLEGFESIAGKRTSPPQIVQKPSTFRRFKIGFQAFERCDVICLPHPSSSHGLSDEYIALFDEEIGQRLADYRLARTHAGA
jgi:hypothetical protein